MARAAHPELYMGYRFALCAIGAGGPEWFSAAAVFNDLFDGSVWVGAAHARGERTLAARLCEAREVQVWLFSRGGAARRVVVKFEEMVSLPLHLDASASAVAMEWVRLQGAEHRGVRDVPEGEVPPELRGLFDPRRA